jgi:hypothetical protein
MLRSLLRRRRVILVDQSAYERLCELAVIGEAAEIVNAASAAWHSLETTEAKQ